MGKNNNGVHDLQILNESTFCIAIRSSLLIIVGALSEAISTVAELRVVVAMHMTGISLCVLCDV